MKKHTCKNYADILKESKTKKISYHDLLLTLEWRERRQQIIKRDDQRCNNCKNKELLEVHHYYYVRNWLPWQYPDDALVTFCAKCHENYHKQNVVKVYKRLDANKFVEVNATPCKRCNGAGRFSIYKHIESGICFKCHGNRYEEFLAEGLLASIS